MPNLISPILKPFHNAIFKSKLTRTTDKISENKNEIENENENENENLDRGTLQLNLKKSEENPSKFLSYKSLLQTIGAEYTSQYGSHTINTEITLRDEIPLPYESNQNSFLLQNLPQKVLPTALFSLKKNNFDEKKVKSGFIPHAKSGSQEVLSNLNSSSKVSVQYTYLKDNRTQINPVLGSYIKSSIELAVPCGVQSAQYVRTDILTQTNIKIPTFRTSDSGMVASFSGSIGERITEIEIFIPNSDLCHHKYSR